MVNGKHVESNWRSHQVPFSEMREKPEHVHLLSEWMKNYKPQDHNNIHVRGCKEEGTSTTPFDICVLNNIDRYQLTLGAIRRIPRLRNVADRAYQQNTEAIQRPKLHVSEFGEDLPEIRNWKWKIN